MTRAGDLVDLVEFFSDIGLGQIAGLQTGKDLLLDRGEDQLGIGIVKNHPDLFRKLSHVFVFIGIFSVKRDVSDNRPAVCVNKNAGDRTGKRGFSGSGRSVDHNELARVYFERNVIESRRICRLIGKCKLIQRDRIARRCVRVGGFDDGLRFLHDRGRRHRDDLGDDDVHQHGAQNDRDQGDRERNDGRDGRFGREEHYEAGDDDEGKTARRGGDRG